MRRAIFVHALSSLCRCGQTGLLQRCAMLAFFVNQTISESTDQCRFDNLLFFGCLKSCQVLDSEEEHELQEASRQSKQQIYAKQISICQAWEQEIFLKNREMVA